MVQETLFLYILIDSDTDDKIVYNILAITINFHLDVFVSPLCAYSDPNAKIWYSGGRG